MRNSQFVIELKLSPLHGLKSAQGVKFNFRGATNYELRITNCEL